MNDDLGAFGRMVAELGRAAAETEARELASMLRRGPTVGGAPMFSAERGNLAAAAAPIDEASISAARLAMRSQRGLNGELITVSPDVLLVGPARETEAERFLATISPAAVADVNVFSGRLRLLVEPRLGGNA